MDYSNNDYGNNDKTPHSQEAEQALLGVLLHGGLAAFAEVRDFIKPKYFYNSIHEKIADVMWRRFGMGLKVDAIILKNRFSQDETLKDIGGVEYLALLLDNAPPTATGPEYAKLVTNLAQRREGIRAAKEAILRYQDPDTDDDAADQLTVFQNDLTAIEGEFAAADNFVDLVDAADTEIEKIGHEEAMGLSTGLTDLDEAIRGLQKEKLYVGAGRPGMFKTGMLANIGRNVARQDKKVGFFSLEMGAGENAVRALSNELGTGTGRIEYRDITSHRVSAADLERLKAAKTTMPNMKIDTTAGITISLLEKRARAMRKAMGGLDLLLIDYIQLMGDSDVRGKNDTRAGALSIITGRLKALTKTLNIPIVALAQVSRGVDSRDNKRPGNSDLRDSGSIEQDADVVMMFYREEYYLRKLPKPEKASDAMDLEARISACENEMEVILTKNRSGPEKTVKVKVDLGTDTVMDMYDDDIPEGFDLYDDYIPAEIDEQQNIV